MLVHKKKQRWLIFLRTLTFVLLTLSVGCSSKTVDSHTVSKEPLVTEKFSADVFLLIEVQQKLPRSAELAEYVEAQRKEGKEGSTSHQYEADTYKIVPIKYYIPAHSLYSTTQHQIGEFRFDAQKLEEAETLFRQNLLGKEQQFTISYQEGIGPTVGEEEIIGIVTVPGFAYYGIPSQTRVFLVPQKAHPDLENLKMDAVYPKVRGHF